jgi:hypothetical protein
MSPRKKSQLDRPAEKEASFPASPEVGKSEAALPSPTTRFVVGGLVLMHLIGLLVSFTAIIEPSTTHNQLLGLLTPYLRATHFSADGRRFYLAHATPDEQPHRLQVARANEFPSFEVDPRTEWTTVEPAGIPGLASQDRYARWMALAAMLAESDRTSLTATLLLPLVDDESQIDAVRVVRLPTQLTTVADDSRGPVFLARVIRDNDSVKLVSIQPKRLTTYPRNPPEGAVTR